MEAQEKYKILLFLMGDYLRHKEIFNEFNNKLPMNIKEELKKQGYWEYSSDIEGKYNRKEAKRPEFGKDHEVYLKLLEKCIPKRNKALRRKLEVFKAAFSEPYLYSPEISGYCDCSRKYFEKLRKQNPDGYFYTEAWNNKTLVKVKEDYTTFKKVVTDLIKNSFHKEMLGTEYFRRNFIRHTSKILKDAQKNIFFYEEGHEMLKLNKDEKEIILRIIMLSPSALKYVLVPTNYRKKSSSVFFLTDEFLKLWDEGINNFKGGFESALMNTFLIDNIKFDNIRCKRAIQNLMLFFLTDVLTNEFLGNLVHTATHIHIKTEEVFEYIRREFNIIALDIKRQDIKTNPIIKRAQKARPSNNQ